MTKFKTTFEFEDGYVAEIEVPSDEAILDTALASGLRLAHQCQSGSCGTCVATLLDGEVEVVAGRGTALLPSEFEAGQRLLCSTVALSDAAFRLSYPSEVVFGPRPRTLPCRVASVQQVSDSVSQLIVELEEPTGVAFRSGQYVRLQVPGTSEWRSYSMSSTPDRLPELEFLVKMLESGVMTEYLRQRCRPGDAMTLRGPLGSFVVRQSPHHLMVAGSTGLAPVISMLDEVRSSRGRRPDVTLCFACQTERDLFYTDELELRSFWMPTLDLRVGVTEPVDSSYQGTVGTPVSLIVEGDVRAETEAYLCGPQGMIDAARERLRELGLGSDRIHAEQFLPSAAGEDDESGEDV